MHPKRHLRTLGSMASTHRPPQPPPLQPPKPLDLEVTIVSGKHLKNVNWRTGDLKPYAVFWVDPDCKRSTKPDESGSTRPVWNERFTIPLSLPLHDSSFFLEIFHSKPSETPKPLVGFLRVPLSDLPDPDDDNRIRTFELTRPSGRPQGKIRVKLCARERPLPPPDYSFTPQHNYYYSSPTAPMPPPPPRDYRYAPPPPTSSLPPAPIPGLREYRYAPPPPPPQTTVVQAYGSYHDTYSAPPSPYCHSGYYSSAPPLPLPPRPSFDHGGGFYGAPSAPVDYAQPHYEQRQKNGGGKIGLGTGLAVGAVAGALGGLALEEGLKYEEEKVAERVENESNSGRGDYNDYRVDY